MKRSTLLFVFCFGMLVLANDRAKLPPCYWTGCVEFNGAECDQGYTSRTKETCGGLEGIETNKQRIRCCKAAGLEDDPNVLIENKCGTSNLKSINGKITQGDLSVKGHFPWLVMLKQERSATAFCAATLLNEEWIITAAHCFGRFPISDIKVKLGKYDQNKTEESEIVTNIEKLIIHPDYNKDTFDNDIALVKLSHKVSFTSYIKPICLMNDKIDEYFQNTESEYGYVSGWGMENEVGPVSRYLRQVVVPIVDQERCTKSTRYEVTSNMFCAGYSKKFKGDACYGDSGGSFILKHQSQWFIFGIVSWGEGCDREGKYGYYTRFNNYLDWVNSAIKQEEISSIEPTSNELEISDCYWTGCVEFNRAECAKGYLLMTKESCGGWEGVVANKRRKWCCK